MRSGANGEPDGAGLLAEKDVSFSWRGATGGSEQGVQCALYHNRTAWAAGALGACASLWSCPESPWEPHGGSGDRVIGPGLTPTPSIAA